MGRGVGRCAVSLAMLVAGAGCGARTPVATEPSVVEVAPTAGPATTGTTLPLAPPPSPVAVEVGPSQAAVELPPPGDPRIVSVVIGIDDYLDEPDLTAAEADVETVTEALVLAGNRPELRRTLLSRDATAAAIRDALRWLVATARPSDIAVLAYAGHAEMSRDGHQSIVSTDGVRLPDIELAGLLGPLTSRAWLLFATCYGGGFDELLAPGRILTAAAGPTEETFEYTNLNRTHLVEYAVRQGWLEGRAGSSVQEAMAYAAGVLARTAPDEVPWVDDRSADLLVLGPVGAPYVTPPPTTPPPAPGDVPRVDPPTSRQPVVAVGAASTLLPEPERRDGGGCSRIGPLLVCP